MAKFTVYREHNTGFPRHLVRTQDRDYPCHPSWAIKRNGQRMDSHTVVMCAPGMTIIDAQGRMVTSWHIGISAGDLARLTMPKLEKKLEAA